MGLGPEVRSKGGRDKGTDGLCTGQTLSKEICRALARSEQPELRSLKGPPKIG